MLSTKFKPTKDTAFHPGAIRDLMMLIILPDFPYPTFGFQVRLAHAAMYIYSKPEKVSHLLEWGLYHPTRRGEGAVRNYRLSEPQFDAEGRLLADSFADICHTVSGLEKRLALRGSAKVLDYGGARQAVQAAKAWAKHPPEYHPLFCSCKSFCETIWTSVGDVSAVSGSPSIREWRGSTEAPSFHYDPGRRELKWTTVPRRFRSNVDVQ